jgi:hypothetical protein
MLNTTIVTITFLHGSVICVDYRKPKLSREAKTLNLHSKMRNSNLGPVQKWMVPAFNIT